MFDSIISFSIRNKFIVALGTLGLIAWGVWSFTRLPIDAIPDITNNQAQVLTVCPTLATQEVEQFVTYPIETAVRTIPGVVELRSISRFGLSVVTVVFEEDIDKYLIRQLLNEKLKIAEAEIPPGYGTPELAPVSTGLGEILHYRIVPKPGYEDKYSPIELRSIQDWIVKRQLAGIPGVVEVNSFGGYLKQYEVAIKPERLRQLGVSLTEILTALENANENTGGAYIEKNSEAFFIRSEGLARTIDDIKKIVVRTEGDTPLLIGDVGEVRIGSALRYGAVSHNAEGEIVLGIVMMLKGENAANVIQRVKERLAQVEQSLPEGVEIITFLDREKLVNRTIATVRNNLIEGALIVIFVLVLLVGNFRAGLIIASVIPLSMLFAIGMMQLTGVTANLMSMGAIDFGLIVDGAVIVVEATLHFLHKKAGAQLAASGGTGPIRLTQTQMDDAVQTAGSRIMRSSVFGVIIILIVYLPILSLTGVEGKMFKPMAETVSFALIGALILSLTYVPAVSAAFLNKKLRVTPTVADRIIGFFQKLYLPTLNFALRRKMLVLTAAVLVLAIAVGNFLRMGGEFIPTLDEGDIMMHGFCRPG
ncbi:MAG: efflux RND transporter permease subunit, partial [Bacteroidetes bacterium]